MATNKNNIKIAIVDDHNLFRKGLIKLISLSTTEKKYQILEAENGVELMEKLNKKSLPHIILMDIDMPGMDGYETAEWLRKNYPDIKILVISMMEAEEVIIRMLRLGVKGFLSKDIEVEDMQIALETIHNKGYYFSDQVTAIMAKNFADNDKNNSEKKSNNRIELSENETQFVKLACSELTYNEIAEKMELSPKTIDGYRESAFQKLKVKTRVGLVLYAIKNRIAEM